MNWKFEAMEKLREYEARKQSLATIPDEIRRLELDYTRIRSATRDGPPVRGGGSTREDMLLSNIVHREELERALEMARMWVALVDAGAGEILHAARARECGAAVPGVGPGKTRCVRSAGQGSAALRAGSLWRARDINFQIRKKTGRLLGSDMIY